MGGLPTVPGRYPQRRGSPRSLRPTIRLRRAWEFRNGSPPRPRRGRPARREAAWAATAGHRARTHRWSGGRDARQAIPPHPPEPPAPSSYLHHLPPRLRDRSMRARQRRRCSRRRQASKQGQSSRPNWNGCPQLLEREGTPATVGSRLPASQPVGLVLRSARTTRPDATGLSDSFDARVGGGLRPRQPGFAVLEGHHTANVGRPQDSDFMISRMSSAVSLGVLPTWTPAASRASFLASAVPVEPDTMAPAWPMVLPSGAVKPAT